MQNSIVTIVIYTYLKEMEMAEKKAVEEIKEAAAPQEAEAPKTTKKTRAAKT